MTTAYLTYNEVERLPQTLTFNTPSSSLLWEKVCYLYATSPDQVNPIIFTSSNPTVLDVQLKNSFWQVEYCGVGTATITASQVGQPSVVKSITVSAKPAPTGRVINVGGSGGTLSITTTDLGLLPGDTVVIAGGDYHNIGITDILITDGEDPVTVITDGLVRLVDESHFSFRNLRNVVIDGSRVPGIKHALLVDGNNYRGIYYDNINYVTFKGIETRNIYDYAWSAEQLDELVYNGTEDSYLKGCRFINCKSDNSSAFLSSGGLNINEEPKLRGLIVDFQFIGWEIVNSSSGSSFYISACQDVLFKDCTFNHINCLNNNHNGVIIANGHADINNCRLTNFQGNLIRMWPFSIADGHLGSGPRTCKFYGNQIFTSRKYGAFEGQSFQYFMESGFTTYCNIDIFNNTCGNMNQNNPTVYTGTLYDNYGLWGGTARLFNNILIDPINSGSNNVFMTYNSGAPGGTETQTGEMQEWNNRVYYTLADAKVNPANLAPRVGNSGKGKATSNTATLVFTHDRYGNAKIGNIGAVQCSDMILPATLVNPTIPGLEPQLLNPSSGSDAATFQIDCNASLSPIGIKNYDFERNGQLITTRGGYCRDGKPDPSADSGLSAWTAYTYKWRARDWRDQVSEWTIAHTFATESETSENGLATALTLTKITGGTLVNTNGVYSATGNAVLASTGIVVPAGYAARLIIDVNVGQGILGWATSSVPGSATDIIAGITTNGDAGRYESFSQGVYKDLRDTENHNILISLYIDYNGNSWCEKSNDGISWNKPANQLTSYYFLGEPNYGAKHIVAYIPTNRVLGHPRIVFYPEPYVIAP
ncbi:hypothetical protein [Pedobacter nyackensis]|uniref:Right handed beta helix region n=1 Tax=Pedobacter nyackensis TaxID=475255 RepID=A0A1W2A1A4_9SPHI|nr:hypothetical protein [Pedobacter nyackensis]SMC54396.1 hypothetical protein SAMN04488101_101240 [Pedobacter nyackensis]